MSRIMPLGDSSTCGMYENLSSPGGCRGPLQDMLRSRNLGFGLVGLDRGGRIAGADHDGYPGKTLDWFTRPVNEAIRDQAGSDSHSVASGSRTAVRFFIAQAGMTLRDVVPVHPGTNDVRPGAPGAAPVRRRRRARQGGPLRRGPAPPPRGRMGPRRLCSCGRR